MFTFNNRRIMPGEKYCECLGLKYFYEDSMDFIGYLIGLLGAEQVLDAIGVEEKSR